jgi:hypothetical protein
LDSGSLMFYYLPSFVSVFPAINHEIVSKYLQEFLFLNQKGKKHEIVNVDCLSYLKSLSFSNIDLNMCETRPFRLGILYPLYYLLSCGKIECACAKMTFINLFSLLTVRGRGAGDVPDGVAEALLHRHEEAGAQEAAEGDQAAPEPLPRPLLRHLRVAPLRDRHLCPHLPQHGLHGHRALRPVQGRHLRAGDLQRALHNHLQFR